MNIQKSNIKDLAIQRINVLLENALKTIKENKQLAQRQANIAWRISTKYNIRLAYEKKRFFCKKCKKFIVPGINSLVRIKNKPKKNIKIICLECGHPYRKFIDNNNK